jgi:hypothetical protein
MFTSHQLRGTPHLKAAEGLPHSKSWRTLEPTLNSRSVLDCASPLALFDDWLYQGQIEVLEW